ncbi:MAG: class I SAM-dependent methyltransferase [Candidatus Delongbacteria bacterium]|nr:class I SAM-dependent methyltransferase [Candidatus Delongbacteria bacterium]MCG2759764.1 class I SAM-dependent methyltransferase [Candidatus Delongbacteria bacterium]
MKTDYFSHDSAYKHRKAHGKDGWASTEETKDFQKTLENVFKNEYVPKTGRFLELGCGAGEMSLWFAEKGFDVYGIDISPTAVEWAKEKASKQDMKADFRVGSVLDLKDYKDNFFDYILDAHCLHCIIGDDREWFLKSAFRVLKRGGFFFSETMCGEIGDAEVLKVFDPVSKCMIRNGIAGRYIGRAEDILEEFKEAGFKILHSEVVSDEFQDNLRMHATKE